jgi:hypothetical protein
MSKTNKYWYPDEQTGAYHQLVDGVLFCSAMCTDGSRDTEEYEVDFDASGDIDGEFERNGKKLTFVEYLSSIEDELRGKE